MIRRISCLVLAAGLVFGAAASVTAAESGNTPVSAKVGDKGKPGAKGGKKKGGKKAVA